MERLTYQRNDQFGKPSGSYIFEIAHKNYKYAYAGIGERYEQVLNHLAAYEDTNLTPEEIAALKAENERLTAELEQYRQAQADGRLHITKVGIGQKLYEPNEYGEIYEWDVVSVGIGGCVGEDYLCDRDDSTDVQTFIYGDIGNGVYLSREEAEEAKDGEQQ